MTRVAYTKKKKEEGRRNSATDPNSSNCAVLPAPTLHDFSPLRAPPASRDTTGDSTNSHPTMTASRSSEPDLGWKRDAAEAFGREDADEQQKKWLKGKYINTNKPASEQSDRLRAILVRAEIEVVDNFRAREKLSRGDKKFLMSRGIEPETPATDQEVKIKELVTTLQQQENDALARQVTYDTQAPQVCSLCTVCVADVTWHLLHAGKHGAGRA